MMRHRFSLLALLFGIACLLYAAYIPAKAWLAQQLLEASWQSRVASHAAVRPWPWADTSALARLRQPRLGIDQIVLAGASGRVLAFGPGHITGTAQPGERGNVVISGHRDTHFRWLKQLVVDDSLILEMASGERRHYIVARLSVHHESEVQLLEPAQGDQLRLLTCFPFDAVQAGTVERFVVTALPAAA